MPMAEQSELQGKSDVTVEQNKEGKHKDDDDALDGSDVIGDAGAQHQPPQLLPKKSGCEEAVRICLAEMKKISKGSNAKLYGRQVEKATLVRCWQQCCQRQQREIVVISGTPGTGKSALADSLRPIVNREKPKAFFLSGKFNESIFHQAHRKTTASGGPFEVFVTAFSSYVDQLFDDTDSAAQDEALVAMCKRKIRDAARTDRDILIQLIPGLARILDAWVPENERSSVSSRRSRQQQPTGLKTQLYGSEAANRLKNAFSNLVAAICSCTPILLFLDDVQWADTASLDLLQVLLQCPQQFPLLVVTAMRAREPTLTSSNVSDTGSEDPSCSSFSEVDDLTESNATEASSMQKSTKERNSFRTTLKRVAAEDNTKVTSIELSNLDSDHIQELVADIFGKRPSQVVTLSEIAHDQTKGNVFHLFQLLRYLVETGTITLQKRGGNVWKWDDATLNENVAGTDSIVDLIVRIIQSLPRPVQEALKAASCLGVDIDSSAIDMVLSTSSMVLLQQAADEGLLLFNPQFGGYRFAHDWIRHSALSLIPEDELGEFHLKLGRRLWRSCSPSALEDNTMYLASLMNTGSHLITEQRERYKAAELNLSAGIKALTLPSFSDAANFLRKGIELLDSDCWKNRYQLSLDLYSYAAKVETVLGNHKFVERCNDEVLENGKSLEDQLPAFATWIRAVEQTGRFQESISMCIDVLQRLGERLPPKASRLQITKEFLRTRLAVRGVPDDAILRLAPMSDKRKIHCMEFLALGHRYSFLAKAPESALFAFRSVLLSLRYGIHEFSPVALAAYALTLCAMKIDCKEGYRLIQLAFKLAERYNSPSSISTVYWIAGAGVLHWTKPMQDSLDALAYSARIAFETGYVGDGLLSRLFQNWVSALTGKKLMYIHQELDDCLRIARLYNQKRTEKGVFGIRCIVQCLEEGAEEDIKLLDSLIEESKQSKETSMVSGLCNFRAELLMLQGDYPEAKRMSTICLESETGVTPFYGGIIVPFIHSLIGIGLCRAGVSPRCNMRFARKHFKTISRATKDCPENYLLYKTLLQAEMAGLKPKHNTDAVCDLYLDSFSCAEDQGHLKMMGLACEKYGDYLASKERRGEAMAQWQKSADLYFEWGAHHLSRLLRKRTGEQKVAPRIVNFERVNSGERDHHLMMESEEETDMDDQMTSATFHM